MRVQHNHSAMNANRHWGITNASIAKSTEKLSSGHKINRAADDAAGLAISEKMRRQIRGLQQGAYNVDDGISFLKVGDGALNEIADMLQRMNELAVKAANDTNTYDDRMFIQDEMAKLTSEINRSFATTTFNEKLIFDGSIRGNYEYAYGIKQAITEIPKDPARIIAGGPFVLDALQAGTQAKINNFPSFLADLSSFPQEGVFVIQVQVPGQEMQTAVLDFAVENPDDSFTVTDFENFFLQKFDSLIQSNELTFSVNSSTGQINMETTGFGGSQARIVIGATSYPGMPAGVKFANSSIFGETVNRIPSSSIYNVMNNTVAITPGQLVALNSSPINNSDIWDLMNGSQMFTWEIQEWEPTPSGIGTQFKQVLDSFSITKSQIIAGYTAIHGTPPTTIAQANTYLQSLNSVGSAGSFSNLSLSPTSVWTNRAGNPHINISGSFTSSIPSSAPPLTQRPAFGPVFSGSYNAAASTNSTSITSTWPAEPSDFIGKLEIEIGNVPGHSTPVKLVVDFSDSTIWSAASTPADLVNYINTWINQTSNHPTPLPMHTNATYNSSRPIATASLDANGRLVITPAEYGFSVNVKESMSDQPMFLGDPYSNAGVNLPSTVTVNIGGANRGPVQIEPLDYNGNIDLFIKKNQSRFRAHNLVLEKVSGCLVIKTRDAGGELIVNSSSLTFSPAALRAQLGFDSATAYINGVTHPPIPGDPRHMWIQSGAESGDGLWISIPRLNIHDLGLMLNTHDINHPASYVGISTTLGTAAYTTVPNVEPLPGFGLDVTSYENASNAIPIIVNALKIVSEERSHIGAQQNRLEHTKGNVLNIHENTTTAESQIRDTDMASEMIRHSLNSILSQAGSAILAQANASNQMVLKLLM